MKVLHIATEKTWRGGENQLRFLVRGLKERGIQSHIVMQPQSSFHDAFADTAQIHQVTMRNDLDIVAALKVANICKLHRPTVIHAHTARAHSLALMAKSLLSYKDTHSPRLVVHRRVEQTKQLALWGKWKYLTPEVDHFICVSQAIAIGMQEAGVAPQKISVVYSAVDPAPHQFHDQLRAAARKEFNIGPDDFVVGCVAAIEQAKGVDVLIEAWKNLHPQLPGSAKLLMVGDGGLLVPLKDRVRISGLQDSVVFTGFRHDVPRLMAACDVLTLPTLWEGLGTVLLDGLLAGCSLIGSQIGGVPEVIHHEKTGLLVPPKDHIALSAAMLRLYQDPNLRRQMTSEGQKHIEQHFSMAAMIDGNIKAYHS